MKSINWLGVVLGLVVGQAVGFVWYGLVFEQRWQALTGMTPTEDAAGKGMAMGAVITLVTVIGLAVAIAKTGANSLAEGAKVGLFAALFFGATNVALDGAYRTDGTELMLIDAGYLVVYYTLAGALIGGVRLVRKG